MKANVDQDTCISCGVCVTTCPEVFSYEDNGKAEATGAVTEDCIANVESARAGCPVDAIDVM